MGKATRRVHGLVGQSALFLAALDEARNVAKLDLPILLQGETGTGKELFAQHIHDLGERGPFIAVNCAATPRELVESEFFGHRRGAFTHAVDDHTGYVAQARDGTLFLDEIDSLDWQLQAKLLRFLQSGEYRPVGDNRTHRSNARVIAASNQPLHQGVVERRFRADLFYRLAVYPISLPPLRNRGRDIRLLFSHFLNRYAEKFAWTAPSLPEPFLEQLETHPWPGNVRELENVAQRLLIKSRENGVGQLEAYLSGSGPKSLSDGSFQAAKERAIHVFERAYLLDLMDRHQGNVSQAARASGKHRRSLHELLRRHEIDAARFRPGHQDG